MTKSKTRKIDDGVSIVSIVGIGKIDVYIDTSLDVEQAKRLIGKLEDVIKQVSNPTVFKVGSGGYYADWKYNEPNTLFTLVYIIGDKTTLEQNDNPNNQIVVTEEQLGYYFDEVETKHE